MVALHRCQSGNTDVGAGTPMSEWDSPSDRQPWLSRSVLKAVRLGRRRSVGSVLGRCRSVGLAPVSVCLPLGGLSLH